MKILDNIKKARIANGFSQEDMAEKLGIATVNYGKIERGVTAMTIDRLFKIAELLNVSVGSLLDIEPKNDNLNNNLQLEIDSLNKRIDELEEQLSDKRSIIQFLSANDLLYSVAMDLDVQSGEYHERRAKSTLDDMLNGTDIKPPYDRENRESLIKYISERIKKWPSSQNK